MRYLDGVIEDIEAQNSKGIRMARGRVCGVQ